MNSVNIIGRMTSDVELKTTNSGKAVCSFRVAVDAGKDREAYFFPCTAWNGTAETIGKYCHKGDKVGIEGILTSRSYESSDGRKVTVVEIMVNRIDFCSGAKKPETQAKPETQDDYGDLPFSV